ncbi:Origin recognition complex subunit 5 [Taphrina deformans PYCC 5710]|uniref:Origin recognition complex subunit 5 n=1 Tax=Taphrina deformans (strain PYCC 5710 / ATCC 11124 / CBS 356.35 / IMI 108563 / JCM 9778 / NBRC 8474) TaxID=1097556 RepID=R4XBR2_TAPDE|nr:Origin recognition complex subunit 5 [Taphrina deformans PYCC 5710]|eukprot:CCG83234.1 Origin recognition complex subunit 5 [Taphrina deformans PYCC 5710]
MLPPNLLQQIEIEFPCRTQELKSLNALLHVHKFEQVSGGTSSDSVSVRTPSILVYGPSQTGKTSLLKQLLESSDEHNYTYIDCRKCIANRALYEYTIDELHTRDPIVLENGDFNHDSESVESLGAFLSGLQRSLSLPINREKILIFDHITSAHYDDLEGLILSLLKLFTSLSQGQTVIFVTSRYEDILPQIMPTVPFLPYSPDELSLILQETTDVQVDIAGSLIKDSEELRGLWERFCKTFFSAFYDIVGQDIELYRTIAVKLFPKYLQPINDNILSVKNHTQLARSAQTLLVPEPWILAETSLVQTSSSVDKVRVEELSTSARFLLIASFLSSYNPGKTDRTFFSRGKGEKTKRRGGKRAIDKVTRQPQKLLGPKGFSAERMLSIFQAIIPTSFKHTALLDQQIATLHSLKLILKQGASGDLLDDGKWVVNVNLETIIKIARSVQFELNRFLVSD